VYASSKDKAAKDCQEIKKRFPFKRNGFYWVNTKCMPDALRVYCDFTDNDGNFYAYIGFPADKVKNNSFQLINFYLFLFNFFIFLFNFFNFKK
jgi:hypothetical protein